MKNKTSGFSLVELLIVVVIIGILAALATAGFLASRRSANEGSTISSLRLLHGAQMTYQTSLGGGEFAGTIGAGTTTTINNLASAGMIDEVLGSGTKSGYNIVGGREVVSPTTPAQFFFSAIPISADSITGTGIRRFGIATDGVMRTDSTAAVHYANVAAATAAPAFGE